MNYKGFKNENSSTLPTNRFEGLQPPEGWVVRCVMQLSTGHEVLGISAIIISDL